MNARETSVTRRLFLLGAPSTVLLAACSLPEQGPRTPTVVAGAKQGRYALVDVNAGVAAALGRPEPSGLGGFGSSAAAEPTDAVGVGDVLDIRILEAGAGGLFARGEGGAGGTEFPGVIVDRDGTINLPYIGAITVVGQTPNAIEGSIVEALRGKAIEPQALVRIAKSESNRATIAGDISNPGPVPLSLRGDRLSQAIASAGGSRFPAHETTVTLVRGGRRGSARLSDVLLNPQSDIALQRDDLVVLTHEPPRYTITGSVRGAGTFKLDTTEYSVLQAVAAAGGPADSRADASGVFLFRYESKGRLAALGRKEFDAIPATSDGVPTVYRFDMGNPEMQFFAQGFYLTAGDALYVSNADTVQLDKILDLFNVGLTSARRVQQLEN